MIDKLENSLDKNKRSPVYDRTFDDNITKIYNFPKDVY